MNAPLNPAVTKPRLTAAYHYAAMGWPVFPTHSVSGGLCTCVDPHCKSKGKHPSTIRGFKDATRTRSQIGSRDWERSNIGIVTGALSGVFVLDIDPRNGGDDSLNDLEAANGKLPDTLTAKTGGGGRHFFFKVPACASIACSTSKVGPGIDVKGNGGYVIAPPSVTAGPYEWLDCDMPAVADIADAPDWLLQLVTSNRPTATTRIVDPATAGLVAQIEAAPTVPQSQEALDEIRSALACVDQYDDRDRWRDVGMALHSTGAGPIAFELWTEWSKQSTKYDLGGQRTAWNSFKPRPDGITIGTLFKLAREKGWQQPIPDDVDITGILEQGQQTVDASTNDEAPSAPPFIETVDAPKYAPITPLDRIPGVLGQFEDYYNETSIAKQPAFAAAASIALGSVALGRLYVARARLDSYASLYLCEVVSTGGGKEYARTIVETALRAAGLNSLIGPLGYTSAAGVWSTLLNKPNHFAFIDELGRHLAAAKKGGDSNQIQVITELMKIWGSFGGEYRYRGYATTGLTDEQRAQYSRVICAPAITMLGASTPNALYEAVGTAGIVDGFLNRMLFFFGNDDAKVDALAQRTEPIPLPDDLIAWLKEVRNREDMGNLWAVTPHDSKPNPIVLLPDREAHSVWRDLQSDVEKQKTRAAKHGLADVLVRTVEKAIRLSLIAAVSDRCSEIRINHAEWATRRAAASDSALERACAGNIADTDHGKLCNAIRVDVTKAVGGISEGKLASVCRKYRDAPPRARTDAIRSLIGDGHIKLACHKGRNGRDTQRLVAITQNGASQ